MNNRIVIADINIRGQGHHLGFDQYILSNYKSKIWQKKIPLDIVFIFNSKAKELLIFDEKDNIHFLDFPDSYYHSVVGKYKIGKMVLTMAFELSASEVLFMELDKFQIPLALSRIQIKISSIYFRPHIRLEPSSTKIFNYLKIKITRYLKIILEKLLLFNPRINTIFILNDASGATKLNKFYGVNNFVRLPDPIFDYPYEKNISLNEHNDTKVSMLIFGAISERKNITNIIQAFKIAKFSKSVVIYIIGGCSDEYYSYLISLISSFEGIGQAGKRIAIERRYVLDSEMETIHKNANVSLLIYKDFFCSSGLLGRNAKYGNYVITPSVGLMPELVKEYNLGTTANADDVNSIAEALERAVMEYEKFDKSGCRRFYIDHKPDQFLEVLLTNI